MDDQLKDPWHQEPNLGNPAERVREAGRGGRPIEERGRPKHDRTCHALIHFPPVGQSRRSRGVGRTAPRGRPISGSEPGSAPIGQARSVVPLVGEPA
jgi:hypothetical protein